MTVTGQYRVGVEPAPSLARPFPEQYKELFTEHGTIMLLLFATPLLFYIPRIRSERPAFEYHYPHLLERLEAEAHAGTRHLTPTSTRRDIDQRARSKETHP